MLIVIEPPMLFWTLRAMRSSPEDLMFYYPNHQPVNFKLVWLPCLALVKERLNLLFRGD